MVCELLEMQLLYNTILAEAKAFPLKKNAAKFCTVFPWELLQTAISEKQLLPTGFPVNMTTGGRIYCALWGVTTSAAWLAPHLLSLVEGVELLGKGNHAAANERVTILLQTPPPGLDFVVKRGGIKKNHISNGFQVGLQCCIRGIKLLFPPPPPE